MTRFLLLLLATCLAGTASAQSPDLLRPVRLTAGVPDTLHVADVFGPTLRPTEVRAAPGLAATLGDDTLVLVPEADLEGLRLLRVVADGDTLGLPVEVTIPTTHTFTFTPDLSAVEGGSTPEVFVIGAFNDWSRGRDRLADDDGDGTLAVTLPIPPGRYEYKYTVDGAEVLDPTSADSVMNPFGAYNNVLTVRPRTEETARLRLVGFEVQDGRSMARFELDRSTPSVEELAAEEPASEEPAVLALLGNDVLDDHDVIGTHGPEGIGVSIPHRPGLHTLRLAAEVGPGVVTPWVEIPLYDGRPLGAAQSDGDAPFTWRDAILYQIVLDRFANGDPSNDAPVERDSLDAPANYHGGDLQGVLQKIEAGYFDRLGVNVLWLSPVYDNPETAYREYPPPHRFYTGYHGYWPVQPRAVDEHLGDLALLRRVVDAAHARGLKVLLDFVANHTHEDHPYVREHRDWFGTLELPDGSLNLRRWDEYRLTTWFEPYLPSFDYDGAPEAIDRMTADAAWWLRETGADGFRHDAVKHIPNAFWRALTARLKTEVAPARSLPLYQIGETFGSDALIGSYVNPGQLDAQFNFNLYDTALPVFLDPAADFATLAGAMDRFLDRYGPLPLMGNLMDSHDKPRFLGLADGDLPPGADDKEIGWTNPPVVDDPASYRRAELYLAYMLTIPGLPTIYYGDEIGMTGANDPDNRRPMRFDGLTDEEARMQDAVSRLVHLRRRHAALRHGAFETLRADGDVWAYLRTTPDDAVLVVLNKSPEATAVTLDLPPAYGFRTIADALGAGPARLDGRRTSLRVPAGGYRIATLGR